MKLKYAILSILNRDGLRIIIDDLGIGGVETKQLKRTVRRNIKRFPDDFMFEPK